MSAANRMKAVLLILLLPVLLGFDDAPLSDPTQELRALRLMDEIRCVACENEPISQSGAEIAGDMRQRVRAMIAEGQTDAQVRAWFVDRYGEFVLFRPQATGASGLILWGFPFALLGLAGAVIGFAVWRRGRTDHSLEIVPLAADDSPVEPAAPVSENVDHGTETET